MDLFELRKAVKDEVLRAGGKLPTPMRLDHLLNLAGRAFLNETKIRRAYDQTAETSHGTAATGHHTYTADPATIEIQEIYFDGVNLTPTSREELSVFVPDWKAADDSTPHSFIVTANRKVRVYPPVSLADSTKVTSDLILGWETDMTEADNDPAGTGREIPEVYHMALVYWAASKLVSSELLKQSYNEFVQLARTETVRSSDDMIDLAPRVASQGAPTQQ